MPNDLTVAKEIIGLLESAGVALEQTHLEKLEMYIEKDGGWHNVSVAHRVAVDAVAYVVEHLDCPSHLLAHLARLAAIAGVECTSVIARIIGEKAWDQARELVLSGDSLATRALVAFFCKNPTTRLCEAILVTPLQLDCVDLLKKTYYGTSFGVLLDAVRQVECVHLARSHFRDLLDVKPENEHFFTGVELLCGVAIPNDEPSVVRAVVKGMDFMRLAYERKETGRYYYERTKEKELLVECYQRCKDLLVSSTCTPITAQLLPVLDELANTPFYHHRELKKLAVELSEILNRVVTGHSDSILACLGLVGPERIHAGAIRYAIQRLSVDCRAAAKRIMAGLQLRESAVIDRGRLENNSDGPIFDPNRTIPEAYDPDSRIWPKNHAISVLLGEAPEKARHAFMCHAASE